MLMGIPRLRPLPVTGYANLNALGASRAEILAALAAGRTGLAPPAEPLGFETAVGAVTAELPELTGELAPWSTRMARMIALLVAQLDEPLRRARARWRPERIAVILGTSTGGALTTEQAYRAWVRDGVLPADYDFRRQHTFGAVLHVVSALTGARGPAWTISTACTSSAKPLASARRLIAADIVDAAIVGGVDTLCALTVLGFQSLQLLDTRACRPFSADRAGLSIGEGGALALVERDGEPRVLIEGVGETSDAYHISAPHPQGHGALAAMTSALEQAGCRAQDVDHINAHGTGTPLNDIAESRAIASLFGVEVPVVSTKGYTGHTLGAAGAIEFAFSACAIEEGWIPASLLTDRVDPAVEVRVPDTLVRGRFRRVLSNSFAFGGSNVSVLLRAP
jgi:3-oxoacyl-[acyl-carrier-protein] synthase-1